MFSMTFSASRPAAGYANAYRRIGVETGVATATPHKLVQMLFDGFQDTLIQARAAMRARQPEAKGRAIGRALEIVEDGLHAGLNMQQGGEIARNLDALYGYVAQRLTHANLHNDEAALDECAALIGPVQEAWAAIGPQVNAARQ